MQVPDQEPNLRASWIDVIAVAVVLVALNIPKSVHVDDAGFIIFAKEFIAHPLRPYDFEFTSGMGSANTTLCPPLLPYWLGLGTLIFGEHIALLKCWLFPFALALSWAVDFFAARLAPSIRKPLLWLCVISPGIAPGFNLMADVPVLALGLSAVALAMRSLEKDSWSLSLSSGVVAGFAIQMKYTGLVWCAAILIWCLLRRRPMRGLIAVAIALAMAVGWEYFLIQSQGESHFLVALQQRQGRPISRMSHLVLPLVTHMAGLAPATALLCLSGLGWSKRAVSAVGLLIVLGIAALAIFPSQSALIARANGKSMLSISNIIYGVMAVPIWISLLRVGPSLLRKAKDAAGVERLYDWFLPLWFIVELGGYFALSPFPAARRLIGMLMVFAFMAGRLAHLVQVPRRSAWGCAAFGSALSLLICYADWHDARAAKIVALESVGRVAAWKNEDPSQSPGRRLGRYASDRIGWTGAAYYFSREGWRPLHTGSEPLPDDVWPGLKRDDFIAVVDFEDRFLTEKFEHPGTQLELVDTVAFGNRFPLRVIVNYYAGGTPMENHGHGRIVSQIYRVVETK